MIFLFIFLHFLATGRAAIGDACDFVLQGTDGCGTVTGKDMECIKQGGTKITEDAWALAGCTANDPFHSCICLDVKVFQEAGQLLTDTWLASEKCQSGEAYRLIDDEGTKLALDHAYAGKDPSTLSATTGILPTSSLAGNSQTKGTADIFRSDASVGLTAGTSKGVCGIPEGDFCLVTYSGTDDIDKSDFCMPGLHCYTGFGDPVAKNGICMDDDTVFTENAWLLKFKVDTLAEIKANRDVLNANQAEIEKNNAAIAANLTAIDLAKKENNDWFRGATDPGDDVPDFKERGKLLLTTTVFIGIFVLPSVLYLVWKQCSQPPQKRSRRANVKADDSDELSDES